MPLFGSFGRENIIDRFAGEGVTDQISQGTFDGVDAGIGNVISSPDTKTIPELGRDLVREAIPGEQNVSLDIGSTEGKLKAAAYLNANGPLQSVVKQNVQEGIGRIREPASEKIGNLAVRQGVKAFGGKALRKAGEKLAAIGLRTATGSTATAGLGAPLMVAWAGADLVDTGIAVGTGKSIGDWANNPEYIRGRSGAKRGVEYDSDLEDQISADTERPFGSESILGGKRVLWGGYDYGWQSPESFNTIRR